MLIFNNSEYLPLQMKQKMFIQKVNSQGGLKWYIDILVIDLMNYCFILSNLETTTLYGDCGTSCPSICTYYYELLLCCGVI